MRARSDLGLVVILSVFLSVAFFGWQRIAQAANAIGTATAHPSATLTVVRPLPTLSSETREPSTPVPTAEVVEGPMDLDLLADPASFFASEVTNKLCAAAAAQMTVGILSGTPDVSRATQLQIHDLEVQQTTTTDSHNGGAGPDGIAATISNLSDVAYELRIYDTRAAALLASAVAIEVTGDPVVLFVWRGAHNWVMTGFRADADPALSPSAVVTGAYVLDPWYPRVSTIWGASDPPGTFQDASEMVRNFLPWKRPEGKYPGRDGKFLILVPVIAPG